MEHEAFACPFCGAPYREIVPSGVVQVKCRYCGGTILVPPRLGGLVRRCPSHPETLAIGFCNDCGGSFCDHCLHIFIISSGPYKVPTYYICPNCLKKRNTKRVYGVMFMGLFFTFAYGLMITTVSTVGGILFILILSMLFMALGYYFKIHPWEKPTIYEREMAARAREAEILTVDARRLYERVLQTYIKVWGSRESGEMMLEKKIIGYMKQGYDREEALRKVAVDELM